MRLELTPVPLELLLGDPGSGSAPRRQLAGLAVPYDVEAAVGYQLVTFAPGSVAVDGHPPLLLGHDPNRPVGVLADHTETPSGLRATFGVDATSDGDSALVQASSGSRAGLSVGVDLIRFELDADNPDRVRVLEARLAETSLVALAAYPGALVDQVAASKPPNGGNMDPNVTPPKPEPDPKPAPDDDDDDQLVDRVIAKLGDRRPALVIAPRPEPEMRLGEYVQTLVRAERGDADARQRIEAALTRGTLEQNPGVVPIAYANQLVDSLGAPRDLFNAMSKADMPSAGMTIRKPEITARPNGDWLADDTAGAPTNAVNIGDHDVAVRQWAWGGSASVALVERSDPSYVETVFSQVIKAYYRDVEASIAAAFPDAVGGAASLGAAVGQYHAAYKSYPNLLVLGGLAYGRLLDATGILMFASGAADAQGAATYAGLRVVASADLPPGDGWVTSSDFLEVRETAPIRLSVSDVTSLSLEIGVTSFYAQDAARQTIGGVAGAVGIPVFTPAKQAGTEQASSRRGEK